MLTKNHGVAAMSDKTRVFKAQLDIVNLDKHRHNTCRFTTALERNESLHHFVLKLLGFCLCYEDKIELCHDGDKYSPDVVIKDVDQHIKTWLGVDEVALNRLKRVAKYADDVWPLTDSDSPWLVDNEEAFLRLSNAHLITVEQHFVEQLTQALQRNLSWHVTIDKHCLAIANDQHYFHTDTLAIRV